MDEITLECPRCGPIEVRLRDLVVIVASRQRLCFDCDRCDAPVRIDEGTWCSDARLASVPRIDAHPDVMLIEHRLGPITEREIHAFRRALDGDRWHWELQHR